MNKLLLFLYLISCQFTTLAQNAPTASPWRDPITVEAKTGNTIVNESEPGVRRYIGVVKAHHQGTVIFGDRAIHQQKTNTVSAAGHVLLVQGDSVTIKSDSLFYDGANRQVTLFGQVLLQTGNSILTATRIEYDLLSGIVRYSGKARLVTGRTILTNPKGSYSTRTRQVITSPPPTAAPIPALPGAAIPGQEMAFVTVPMQTVSRTTAHDRPLITAPKTGRPQKPGVVMVTKQHQTTRQPAMASGTSLPGTSAPRPDQAPGSLASTSKGQITAANESKESTVSYMTRARSSQQPAQSARILPQSAASATDESDLERLLNRKKQVY